MKAVRQPDGSFVHYWPQYVLDGERKDGEAMKLLETWITRIAGQVDRLHQRRDPSSDLPKLINELDLALRGFKKACRPAFESGERLTELRRQAWRDPDEIVEGPVYVIEGGRASGGLASSAAPLTGHSTTVV